MLPGYRCPKTYTPAGKYPDDWSPFDRIHPPSWRAYQYPPAPEWLNTTEMLLDRHAQNSETARKTAIIADDSPFTYEQVLRLVCKAANALSDKLGLDYDNRILILAPDRIDAVVAWLVAHRCGVVPCWVSPLYKAQDIRYFIEDLACKALFIDASILPKLQEIQDILPATLKHIVVFGTDAEKDGARTFHDLVDNMAEEFTPFKKYIDDLAYMFYSGGTTGRAKGVAHTVRDFTWVPGTFIQFMEWLPTDVHYDTSPKFHTHGLWPGLLMPLWNGATTIMLSTKLSPELLVETVEKHRPQILTTVPPVLKWLVAYPSEKGRKPDLSSLKMVHSAAEKIPMVIHQRFKELYGFEICDSIGSSEIAYEWLSNNPKENKMGTCGKPIDGCEAILIDPQTSEIVREPNTHGELWVKSDSVLFFYWRKYHKSKDSLMGPWARTGDVMYFDADGFFWHVGRTDDVFKVSGMWVSPLEVENSLLKHQRVKDVAVVPIADEQNYLTYPKAFVVMAPGDSLTSDLVIELQEMVRKDIGGYKVPKWIERIDEIPKTALQKVSRTTLRQKKES